MPGYQGNFPNAAGYLGNLLGKFPKCLGFWEIPLIRILIKNVIAVVSCKKLALFPKLRWLLWGGGVNSK